MKKVGTLKKTQENLLPQDIFLTKACEFSKQVTKLINTGNASTKLYVDFKYEIT